MYRLLDAVVTFHRSLPPARMKSFKAAKHALSLAEVDVKEIQSLIYTGVCREHFEPATAFAVAAGLEINPHSTIYSISNACLGALNGIIDTANRIELGQIRAKLVVSCETAREINDITIDRMLERKEMSFFAEGLATLTLEGRAPGRYC